MNTRKRVTVYTTHMVYVNVMNEKQQVEFDTEHNGPQMMELSRGKWHAKEVYKADEHGAMAWVLQVVKFK